MKCGKKLAEIHLCVPVEELARLPPIRSLIIQEVKTHLCAIREKELMIRALRQKIVELKLKIERVQQELEDLSWHEVIESREASTQTD